MHTHDMHMRMHTHDTRRQHVHAHVHVHVACACMWHVHRQTVLPLASTFFSLPGGWGRAGPVPPFLGCPPWL